MTLLGIFHTGCGCLALVLGGLIFLSVKGTRFHVRLGWTYVLSMVGLNASAFCLYNLTGRFNIFHILACVSLVMLAIGVTQVIGSRKPRWLWRHYQYMAWSYVGLLAATCNEALVRIPPLKKLAPYTLFVIAPFMILSAIVIFGLQKRVLARYGSKFENEQL